MLHTEGFGANQYQPMSLLSLERMKDRSKQDENGRNCGDATDLLMFHPDSHT